MPRQSINIFNSSLLWNCLNTFQWIAITAKSYTLLLNIFHLNPLLDTTPRMIHQNQTKKTHKSVDFISSTWKCDNAYRPLNRIPIFHASLCKAKDNGNSFLSSPPTGQLYLKIIKLSFLCWCCFRFTLLLRFLKYWRCTNSLRCVFQPHGGSTSQRSKSSSDEEFSGCHVPLLHVGPNWPVF